MVNSSKLRGIIIGNNFTNEETAKKLGISNQSFSMKLNNKREFKASEISALMKLFNITNPNEIITIFFANYVELNSTTN